MKRKSLFELPIGRKYTLSLVKYDDHALINSALICPLCLFNVRHLGPNRWALDIGKYAVLSEYYG